MKGYTLIEVLIAIFLLMIILTGGSTLFFQNMRSSGLSEVDLALNSSLNTALVEIDKNVRFSQIASVSAGTRYDCTSAGTDGFTGDSLTVTDLEGLTTIYSLSNNKIASTSAVTGVEVFLTPENISVTGLDFTWYCLGNVRERLKVVITGESTALSTGITISREVSSDIDLLNSGIN